MDHIELPEDRDLLDVSVPYLVTPELEYDSQGFDSFPARKGFRLDASGKLTLASLQERPAEYSVGFVQAWLYFGLLIEVIGAAQFRKEEWVAESNICSKRLPEVMKYKGNSLQLKTEGPPFSRILRNGIHWFINGLIDLSPERFNREERARIRRVIARALQSCDDLDVP